MFLLIFLHKIYFKIHAFVLIKMVNVGEVVHLNPASLLQETNFENIVAKEEITTDHESCKSPYSLACLCDFDLSYR